MTKFILLTATIQVLAFTAISQTNPPAAVAPAPVATPAPAAPTASKSITISGWSVFGDKTKAFGPKEEGGKILFSGADFGKREKPLPAILRRPSSGTVRPSVLKATFNLQESARWGLSGMESSKNGPGIIVADGWVTVFMLVFGLICPRAIFWLACLKTWVPLMV